MAQTGTVRTSSARGSSTTTVSGSQHWGNNYNSTWRHRRHYRPRSRVFIGVGFGYPYGYGYGYPYRYPYGYGYGYGRAVYDAPVANDDATVIAVQQRLARAGYYRGAIDGVMGPGTRSAIRSYERTHGLRVDGAIDRRLLTTMGLA